MSQNVKVDGVDLRSSSRLLYYESSPSTGSALWASRASYSPFLIIHHNPGFVVGVTGGLREDPGTERWTVNQSRHTPFIYTPTFSYHLSCAAISWGDRGTETWLPLSLSIHTCTSIRRSCSRLPFKRVVVVFFSASALCASVKAHWGHLDSKRHYINKVELKVFCAERLVRL